jgi:hypothetical protein
MLAAMAGLFCRTTEARTIAVRAASKARVIKAVRFILTLQIDFFVGPRFGPLPFVLSGGTYKHGFACRFSRNEGGNVEKRREAARASSFAS